MTRPTRSAPQGVPIYDVDPEAPTKRSWLRKAREDLNLAHDIATGKNSPPAVLDHTGPGNGSLLGIPLNGLGNRWDFEARAGFESAQNYILAKLFYKPVGETEIAAMFRGSGPYIDPTGYRFVVVDVTTGTQAVNTAFVYDATRSTYYAVSRGELPADPGSGTERLYLAYIQATLGETSRSIYDDLQLFHLRGPYAAGGLARPSRASFAQVNTGAGLGDSACLDFTDMDSAHLGDTDNDYDSATLATLEEYGFPVDGFTVTRLAEDQNGLMEYVTGAPAGGNGSYALQDDSSADPLETAFLDHSNKGAIKANLEPLTHCPVLSVAYGPALVSGSAANKGRGLQTPTGGLVEAPGLNVAAPTGTVELGRHIFQVPDFKVGGASKLRLACCVYAADKEISLGKTALQWLPQVFEQGNTSKATPTVSSWTQIGSSNLYYAEVGNVDFDAGEVLMILDRYNASTLGATDGESVRPLSICAFFNK